MKTKLLIIIFAFFWTTSSFGQSNYYFGYQNGFKYGCQCNDMPTKNVAYTEGTYDAGYLAGKIDGLIYSQNKSKEPNRNTTKPHDYDQPTYEPDYEVIKDVLRQKQNSLNIRRKEVQKEYDNIIEIMGAAKSRNGELTQTQKDYVIWFHNEIDKIPKIDLSVNQNHLNVMNWFKGVRASVLKW